MRPPRLVADVVRSSRGHDLALYAAGVTFYAAVGVVPLLLVAVALADDLSGGGVVSRSIGDLAAQVPTALGARSALLALARDGTRLGTGQLLVALLPASLYAEGLVRAFDRLSVHGDRGRRTLRARLWTLVVAVLLPLVVLVGLLAASAAVRDLGTGTGWDALRVYLVFLVGWLCISVLLLVAYRGLAPERPGPRALLWGAFGAGSVVAGTAMGFLVFLSLDVPVGSAYGGAKGLADAALALLWLYLLHVLVLLGYVVTLQLAARRGHPTATAAGPSTVRPA